MTPYAPPRSELAAVATLDVDLKKGIAPVCLKCAATKDVAPRQEKLQVVPPRVRYIAVGVMSALGASMAFVESVALRMAFIGAVFVGARLLRVGLVRAYPKVDIGLPLCPTCNDRWTTGMRRRKIFRWLALACVVGMLACLALGAPVVGMLFLFPGVAFTIATALVRIRSRVITAIGRKDDVVTLALVHPDAVAAIRGGQ